MKKYAIIILLLTNAFIGIIIVLSLIKNTSDNSPTAEQPQELSSPPKFPPPRPPLQKHSIEDAVSLIKAEEIKENLYYLVVTCFTTSLHI